MRRSLRRFSLPLAIAMTLAHAPGLLGQTRPATPGPAAPPAVGAPAAPAPGGVVRVKDIARISGVRGNQLFGYGLVVGLAGTGDSRAAAFTMQAVVNMLNRLGIAVPASQIRIKNVAAVMVTAELPGFGREGDRIDVTMSSIGDAKSLVGGVLLQTPLQAADGHVYAVAQGPVAIGGAGAAAGGTSVAINHLTVGRIPGGAFVERAVPSALPAGGAITVVLASPDFTTAQRVSDAINAAFGASVAAAIDGARVTVTIPETFNGGLVAFVTRVEAVTLRPDTAARVVINERTGTVIIGGGVRLLPVAIAHGSLRVEIQATPQVSQPNPLSPGQTRVVTQNQVTIAQDGGAVVPIGGTSSVQDLARALNALGVTPRDLIAILQALRAAGALQGEVVLQ